MLSLLPRREFSVTALSNMGFLSMAKVVGYVFNLSLGYARLPSNNRSTSTVDIRDVEAGFALLKIEETPQLCDAF